MSLPESIYGLWQRDSLVMQSGEAEAKMRVFWAQTASVFVDLRIPADRPNCDISQIPMMDIGELKKLGQQKGFAGHLSRNGDVFFWHRDIDFRPPTARPDEGIVTIVGDKLYEGGDADAVLGEPYREIYSRRSRAAPRRIGLELISHDGAPFCGSPADTAYLVMIDDVFMFARSRPQRVRQAESLVELLVEAKEKGQPLLPLLDCHVAKGTVVGRTPFSIDLSTHPWTEGRPLFQIIDATMSKGSIALDHGTAKSVWRIRDSNISDDRLCQLFASG